VGTEIPDPLRLQIGDGGVGAAVQQRHPIIIGAHMHAALVDADLRRPLDRRLVIGGGGPGRILFKPAIAVHVGLSSRTLLRDRTVHPTWLRYG
jgi:hypothetical protein